MIRYTIMTTITNVGWYLFSTDTDKSWNELKINWGLENCTVYQYIYELSGVPIANETQLGNNNWSPINVGNNNNPNLKRYTAYWVNVTNVDNLVSQTIFYYSNTTTTRPDGLTSITSDSYDKDVSLNRVSIGSNVTTIGENAFAYATALVSVTFASGSQLTSIGQYAFQGASSLTEITIPATVTSIGADVFLQASSLTSITVNQSNQNYKDISGVLFNIDGTTLIQYPVGNTRTTYEIPEGVTSIGESAFFEASNLTSITIPASVTSIGSGAFNGATSLTSVTFAEGSQLTSIGNTAFYYATSLTSISIPAGVTSIGNRAFEGATSLTSVTFASGSLLTSIGNTAFQSATSLTSITIPASVTSIGNYAFYYATSLTSITIPAKVTSIGNNAFYNASSLTTVYIANGQLGITSPATNVSFFGTSVNTNNIYYSDNGTTATFLGVSGETLSGATVNLSGATIAIIEGYTTIGTTAFYYATSLTSISIPAGVTSIGDYAFGDATSLTSVTFAEGSQLTSIGSYAFYGASSFTSISIPASVTNIGPGAFSGATSLTTVYIANDQLYDISSPATNVSFFGRTVTTEIPQ